MEQETTICELSPSPIVNLKAYVYSVLAIAVIIAAAILTKVNWMFLALIIPVFYAFWKWMQLKSTKLKITNQRIIVRDGILNRTTNETELYRVRDSSIEEPFFYRMFGCGNVIIYTTDEADATLRFNAYKKPHWIKDQIRNYSEACRQSKRYGIDSIMIHEQLQNPNT